MKNQTPKIKKAPKVIIRKNPNFMKEADTNRNRQSAQTPMVKKKLSK